MEEKGKEERKLIDLDDIKSVKFDIKFSVPKEEFDELLRKMAHLTEEPNKKKKKANTKTKE
jgi:hypothetical protein